MQGFSRTGIKISIQPVDSIRSGPASSSSVPFLGNFKDIGPARLGKPQAFQQDLCKFELPRTMI